MNKIIYALLLFAVMVFVLATVLGCTTPSCRDNPRNMSCMTADQLEKELNQ